MSTNSQNVKEKSQKAFIIYLDQRKPIAALSLEQKGMLLDACFAWHAGEPVEIADPLVALAFAFFEQGFEREIQKYQDICTKRKASAAARWGNRDNASDANDANAFLPMQTMPYQDQDQDQEQEFKTTPVGVVVGGSPADPDDSAELPGLTLPEGDGKQKAASPPPCPHGDIVAAYHAELAELPAVKVWEGTRRQNLQARWRERWYAGKYRTQPEGVAYWRRLFRHVHDNCDWLMGKITGSRDDRPFRADLAWLVKPENFFKLIEGKYDNRQEAYA